VRRAAVAALVSYLPEGVLGFEVVEVPRLELEDGLLAELRDEDEEGFVADERLDEEELRRCVLVLGFDREEEDEDRQEEPEERELPPRRWKASAASAKTNADMRAAIAAIFSFIVCCDSRFC